MGTGVIQYMLGYRETLYISNQHLQVMNQEYMAKSMWTTIVYFCSGLQQDDTSKTGP